MDSSHPVAWNESQASILGFRMRHMLHFLRFYIPDGRTVTMVLGTPMGESSGYAYDYAAAGIYPPSAAYGEGELMDVTLYSANKVAHVAPINLSGRDFKAGHITSVPLKPLSAEDFFCVDFSLDSNNLGEDVEILTMTLPEGIAWPGTESNVYTIGTGLGTGESFRISTTSEDEFRALSGQTVTVSYESENAIVHESFSFEDLSSVSKTAKSLNCPYLLFEDFSGVGTFQSNDGPFTQRPRKVTVWLKYKSGIIPEKCFNGKPDDYDILDSYHGNFVTNQDIDEWTKVEIPLEYTTTSRKPTHIIISAAASMLGDYFTGSPDSIMWLDDVRLEY